MGYVEQQVDATREYLNNLLTRVRMGSTMKNSTVRYRTCWRRLRGSCRERTGGPNMGLSVLGPKSLRKIERRTGLTVEWGSVACHGPSKWTWRFWVREGDQYRLGLWRLREDTWELTESRRSITDEY